MISAGELKPTLHRPDDRGCPAAGGRLTAQDAGASPIRGFSWQRVYVGLCPLRAPCSALGDSSRADLPTRDPYNLKPSKPADGWSSLLRHPSWSDDCKQVQEYSTCFPSPTPFGLGLGSD